MQTKVHADSPLIARWRARVLGTRRLSSTGYELTIERNGLPFNAGQLVTLHGQDPLDDRSYTIASGEKEDCIQILYRAIPTGRLTPQLVRLQAGDTIEISGTYGEFTIRDLHRPLVFVATGTGIAPCRSYLRTYEGLDLTIIHGVRSAEDLFYRDEFRSVPYFPCVSGEKGPDFYGRVTDFAGGFAFPPNAHFYLCGANEMFYDMRDVLQARGVDPMSVFTEAYYYRSDT